MLQINKFNIRVYGVLFNDEKKILVEDTIIAGRKYTKFPGGGLEFGESTHDCLIREFNEEVNLRVHILEHLYTTDIFQPSAFDDYSQIISIYYMISSGELDDIKVSKKKFDIDMLNGIVSSFRWAKLNRLLKEKYFTLPLDRIVGSILLEKDTYSYAN